MTEMSHYKDVKIAVLQQGFMNMLQKHKMTSKKEKVLAKNRRYKEEPNENFETEK